MYNKKKFSYVTYIFLLLVFFLVLLSGGFFLFESKKEHSSFVVLDSASSGLVLENMLHQRVKIVLKQRENSYQKFSGINDGSKRRKVGSVDIVLGDGSGIFVSKDGLILTNKHVVDNPRADYFVSVFGGDTYFVDKIWYHKNLDLALIKIKGYHPKDVAVFVDKKNEYSVGDSVFLVGKGKIGTGVVLDFHASGVVTGFFSEMILTNIVVSPGNSGSPLFNKYGKVIAIITAHDILGGTYAIPFSQDDLHMFIKSIKMEM